MSFAPCRALQSSVIDEIVAKVSRTPGSDDSLSVEKNIITDIQSFLSIVEQEPETKGHSFKECLVVSAFNVQKVIDSEQNSEQFEALLREIRARDISVLLLVDKTESALAEKVLEISETLGLNVEAILQGTPSNLIAHRLKQLIEQTKKNQAILEQRKLVEETNNHLIREQETAKAVFEKVTCEHQIDLPNVRQWLSPIAVFNGDVFMSAPTPNNGLLVLLGDFTGHGLGASLGAIPLAATFYRMASKGFTLRDIVVEMNRRLNESLPTGFFCCAMAAHIDFERESVEYINAGLPDCYWLKHSSGELKPLVSTALPLGILKPDQFDVDTHLIKVNVSDRLFLLSDGLLETENQYGEAFGAHRIVKSANGEYLKSQQSSADANYLKAMRHAVATFMSGQERFDDISFAEVEIVSAEQFSGSFSRTVIEETQKPSSWSMQLSYSAQSITNRDPIPQVLNLLLDEPGLKNHTGTIFTIVSELYNNALDHGVLQLDSRIKDGSSGFSAFYEQRNRMLDQLTEGKISFDMNYEACAETGCLKIIVSDSGLGFDWHRYAKASLEPNFTNTDSIPHGRGLNLLRELCDSLTFNGKGNSVKAVFSWDRAASSCKKTNLDAA